MADPGEPSAMPPMYMMIAAAVSLFILAIVVSYFAYFPVKNFLADREKYINNNISDSEKLNSDAKKNLEASNKKMSSSKEEGKSIIDEYTKAASTKKDVILKKAKEDAGSIISAANEQLEIEQMKMREKMTQEAITLSILAAEKLIDKNLDTADNKKLISDFIKGLDNQ
jgi:F-type H+-transporting ATPase subunit b